MRTRNQRGRFASPKKRTRNSLGRFSAKPPMDVRKKEQIPKLEKLLRKTGMCTYVLIHADWCGHCQTFKPMWKEFENTPGRRANIVSVHHDMVENSPTLSNAKIQGYPTVIKVEPSGAIEEYKVPGTGETTNAVPFMRDEKKMKQELVAPEPPANSGIPGPQAGIVNVQNLVKKEEGLAAQKGGAFESVLGSLSGALQQAGPAMVLLFANAMLPKSKRSTKTYKSPKRSSRRASTRRNK